MPVQNEYACADKAAAWTLLARMYLNAEVYRGTDRYADCITYCEKVINAGYTLEPTYEHLFYADNNLSNEIIFLLLSMDSIPRPMVVPPSWCMLHWWHACC